MSDLNKVAAALRAAAAVLDSDTVVAAAPSLSDKIRSFLENDQSGYEWRSAKAIAEAIGSTEGEVATAARTGNLQSRNSSRGLGVLISL